MREGHEKASVDNRIDADELRGVEEALAFVDNRIDADELRGVEEALASIGFEGSVSPSFGFKSVGDVPWVLMIYLPAAQFLSGFFGAAGKDAWMAFKDFVVDIWTARNGRSGTINFSPKDSSPYVVIPGGLPDEAYKALLDLDFDEFKGGYLYWDDKSGEWKDHYANR